MIVGAGPTGLATAIELGSRNLRCLVVDRDDRAGYSPRAKIVNVRTREHLRRWGIADELKHSSPLEPDHPSTAVFVTRMNGHLLARFNNAMNGDCVRNNLYSEEAQWVPQYVLEDVLRRHVRSLPGIEVALSHELTGASQNDEGVTARIQNCETREDSEIHCRFLVGADGAGSRTREIIGATMMGQQSLSQNCTIVFRAPELADRHLHGRAIMYWMVNEDTPGLLGPMSSDGLWFFTATRLPHGSLAGVDLVDLIRRTTGIHELDIEIVGADPWDARSLVADRYSAGRVFLAGDACHLNPPHGGFGMNMGIGDAVDLGWKIAATLQGWGGMELLTTYEIERRVVHERTIDEAVTYHNTFGNRLLRPGMEDAGPIGETTRQEVGDLIESTKIFDFKTLGIVLGSHYRHSPIVVPDGSEPPAESTITYTPSAHPGCLAPHLWLADGSSLYDHFGSGFSFLVTSGRREAAEPILAVARENGLPLKLVAPDDGRLAERYEARYVLIRPDQHVAWRGHEMPDDLNGLLERVCGGFSPAVLDAPSSAPLQPLTS
ncbi:FAD-dependent monooxygenase [Streptomyces guryensis]|uniref:FAD-dependent monooxygenase n=1 Tax=Streptomyces guryensis TaxID=2886947 RepID=A0A9Q3VUP8_9ACTN|nr:FAD-dependent monooxygenase [Streptomyces guryensis]MCD9878949.1 FAD-dependent monooxygenase [Streptomyces guryensis]